MSQFVNWDGKNVPEEMRALPPGRYVVEPVDEDTSLTPEEEQGISQAIAALEAGRGSSLEEVRQRIMRALRR